jgi:O-antigen/teichoic acid export membrane protein
LPDESYSRHDLKRAAASGVQWSFLGTLVNQVGRLGFSLALARIVGPDDFGIVQQATIYMLFMMLLQDQGFGMALIQRRHLDDESVRSVSSLNLLMTVVLVAATFLAAPLMADLFHTPELAGVLRVLTLSTIINGLSVVPIAMVNRQLRFKELAAIQSVSVLIGGTVGIVSALAGAGYWAIVTQSLVLDGLALIGLLRLSGLPGVSRSFGRLREMLRFSSFQFGSQILSFLGTNLDNILIAGRLDPRQLAFYAISYRFLSMPVQMLGTVVNRVALPIFSRAQDDLATVRSWFIAATRLAGAVLFPAFTLLLVGAPDGVRLVFGERWEPAIVPLQVLAVAGFSRGIRLLLPPLCQALGRTDLNFAWSLLSLAVAAPGFVIGLHWGIRGVAVSVAITSTVLGIGHLRIAGRLVGVTQLDMAKVMGPLLGCSAVLAATWIAVRTGLDAAGAPRLVLVVVASALAALAYAASIYRLAPATSSAVRQMAALMRQRT